MAKPRRTPRAFRVASLPLLYRGSVKNLRSLKSPTATRPGRILFEFTDDYSVFDYGKMPDTIPGKGSSMAALSAFAFERLEDRRAWKELADSSSWKAIGSSEFRSRILGGKGYKTLAREGLRTHYVSLRGEDGRPLTTGDLHSGGEPPRLMEVEAVPILRPEPCAVEGGVLWNYNRLHPGLASFLVPLEVIFRFGVPRGSSLLERTARDPAYVKALGLSAPPREGSRLERPILELFSKLEPGDRWLPPELALNVSGLPSEAFVALRESALLIALFLHDLFGRAGIEVWDGKIEFIRAGGKVLLADAVTPDELRLLYHGVQISKEPLRQHYKLNHPEFLEAMKRAKERARAEGGTLHHHLRDDPDGTPPPLPKELRALMADMYRGLTREVTGLPVPGGKPLEQVIADLRRIGLA